jgi:hypothetical protein
VGNIPMRPGVAGVRAAPLKSLYRLTQSISFCVTRIVRGHPRDSASRTQYTSPSKEIHDTIGTAPSVAGAPGAGGRIDDFMR